MKISMSSRAVLLVLFLLHSAFAAAMDLFLLKQYRPGTDVSGWLMSEKLDGIRAYWDGKQLLSRQGNVFAAPGWFTESFPPFALDGELWVGRQQFELVASITAKDRPHARWRQVTYNVFEVPHAGGGLRERLDELSRFLRKRPVSNLRVIPQIRCEGAGHLEAELERVIAVGGEGLVLRKPDTEYVTGRGDNALKVKRFADMEGRVIGYRPGKGKYTGMTGALHIELADGTRFYLGSGLSDDERRNPPPIGSLVTFRYQGFTRKKVPRFASFMRVRKLSETQ